MFLSLCPAVQNERQPRNTAQVREDQIEQELEHSLVPSSATVSATHPAFSPGSGQRFMASLVNLDKTSSKNDSDDAGEIYLNRELPDICSLYFA